MAQTILYYPAINIPNNTWLKSALLYWDKISSILPYADYCNLSPELLYLQNQGYYSPVIPQELFHSAYTEQFVQTVKDRFKKRSTQSNAATSVHYDSRTAPAYDLIHYNKLSPELSNFFYEHHLVRHNSEQNWIEMDSRAASIYMRTLAEFLIKCYPDDMVVGTDQLQSQKQLYPAFPGHSPSCISLSLEHCLPQPAPNVGLEDILRFKATHQEDFNYFQKKLRDFESRLAGCNEIEELKSETERFKEEWQAALRKKQRLFTGRFVLGTLKDLISIPSAAAALHNVLQQYLPRAGKLISSSALLSGAAAISIGCQYVNFKNRVNAQRSTSGFSYVIKAEQEGLFSHF